MKFVSFFLISILLVGVFLFFQPSVTAQQNSAILALDENTIQVTFYSTPYSIINRSTTSIISMQDCNTTLTPGTPKLPVKTLVVGIPPRSTVTSIHLLEDNIITLNGNYILPYSAPIANDSVVIDAITDEKTFSKTSFFPNSSYEYCGTGHIGSYYYVKIRFYPFSYCQHDSRLQLHKKIVINIEYECKQETSSIQYDYKYSKKTNELASTTLLNYNEISHLYHTEYNFSNEYFPYVIITTTPSQESVTFLKNWREITSGHPVKVVNISWIKTAYTGEDTPQKIKNFLIEKHIQWCTEYVLFVGSNQYIPMRACYPNNADHSSQTKTLTDYYYADLTGEWDRDNDGYYGEKHDDSPDFSPELYIGRIPVDNPFSVEQICQKIIAFEQNNQSWKQQSLLIGAILYYAKENDNNDKTDGAALMESIKKDICLHHNFVVTTLYEKEGVSPSTYGCDTPLSQDAVKQYWSQGYGIVDWNAHGSPWSSQRKIWEVDDGDGIPEDHELSSSDFISFQDAVYLNNDKPSIVFSCSCKNADPDEQNNLGVSILKNGGVGFIGATSTSWSTVGWNSVEDGGIQTINYRFLYYLIQQQSPCAESLYRTLFEYSMKYDWWDWKGYQNLYCFNLYGDPCLSLTTYSGFFAPLTPEQPQGDTKINVSTEHIFSTSTTDPDEDQLWYKWDWGDGTYSPWVGPYYSDDITKLSHIWDKPGKYMIRVKARDSLGMESNWSNSLTLTVIASELHINQISGGFGTVKAVVSNDGINSARNINWSITVNKPFSSVCTQGTISLLKAKEQVVIKSDFLFGIGPVDVTITLSQFHVQEKTDGFLFGPFLQLR